MTLQQLRYLQALGAQGSFVAAAEACQVSQPTLTVQLRKLEEELGVPLVNREQQPLQLTAIGQQVAATAQHMLQLEAQVQAQVAEAQQGLGGSLRLGIIPTLAPYLLPSFIPAVRAELPQLEVIIEELQSEAIMAGLRGGSLDVGLLVTPLGEPDLREHALFQEPFLLYAAPEHPLMQAPVLTMAALSGQPGLWLLQEGHCFRNQILRLCRPEQRPPQAGPGLHYTSGALHTLMRVVDAAGGFTLIPQLAVADACDPAHTRAFGGQVPVREVSMVVPLTYVRATLLEALKGLLTRHLPPGIQPAEEAIRIAWR